ncbi:MAG TPA: T9SS type A sorting domain-containing protein, partial [Bacteroidales bacterium]|nr:T9SS type A sorting domain-containing protein [Bacteroidales bacterium]
YIIMDSDKNVTASFSLIPTFTLSTNATNGSIAIDPSSDTFEKGTLVTVTAIPDDGYEFSEWNGDLSGSVNPETITIDENKDITAVFAIITSVNDALKNSPVEHMLVQNYPNPFSDKTTIHYHLNETGHIKLSIYNSFGQPVAVLVDKKQNAGYHSTDWYARDKNGRKLSEGVYFYQLETSMHAVHTRKLILMR